MRRKPANPKGSDWEPFVGFRMPPEDLALLDEYAKEQDAARSVLIREAIAEFLEGKGLRETTDDLAEAS